eukprot:TRINITY_DN4016_c0_g3_i1.p1 TRINITY_DN4016_c0_g3~~TRINITY_DN4016_c0_g3_i1.p1  ORF type:complete len:1394 (+),score=358.60 TRINITY_DN4016_c0_g3_i1:57-4238(+)
MATPALLLLGLAGSPPAASADAAPRYFPGAPLDCPNGVCPDCEKLGLAPGANSGVPTWFENSCPDHLAADVKYCIDLMWTHTNHEGESTIHNDLDHQGAPYNILVIFCSFAIGAMVRFVTMDTGIPYTVVLFLLGMAWGALSRMNAFEKKMANYVALADMDPHLIFHIFLPALIFESAFAMHIPTFKKVICHCLILAVPGIMLAAGLTGAVAKAAFTDYDWPWTACLLFGTILSATDPVAVVALLKDLGASPVISTMIEGESLFNDGTAIVFFNVLLDSVLVKNCSPSPWSSCFYAGAGDKCSCSEFDCEMPMSAGEVVLEFFKVSLGGPLIGFVVARVTVFSLNKVFNDPLIEITTTLVAAYVTFFVAEGMLHVSGVLGCVVCGCWLSHFRQCISPEVEHTMHHFWEMTVYLTNTMIFLLAGIIVSRKAFDSVTYSDFVYLLIIYCACNVVRFLVIGCFMPLLLRFEYKLTFSSTMLVGWGGLRGAVGLALALLIEANEDVAYETVRTKFIFHVAGIVILTLCVNGTTTGKLVAHFKLDKVPDRNKRMMKERFRALLHDQHETIRDLREEALYYDTNWEVADRMTDLKSRLKDGHADPFNKKGEEIGAGETAAERKNGLLEDARCVYLNAVVGSVHNQESRGTLSRRGVRKLLQWVAEARELKPTESNPLCVLMGSQVQPLFDVKESRGQKVGAKVLSGYGRISVQRKWREAFDITLGFIECHKLACSRVVSICTKLEGAVMEQHCKAAIVEANRHLLQPSLQLPEISCGIKTKQAARSVLNHMRLMLGTMAHNGRIDATDRAELRSLIETRMQDLRRMPGSIEPPTSTEILASTAWFQSAEPMAQESLLQLASAPGSLLVEGAVRPLAAKKGVEPGVPDRLSADAAAGYDIGSKKDLPGIYIIISGIVELRVGRKLYQYGSGYTVGLQQLLCPGVVSGRRFSDVWTVTRCSFLYLDAASVYGLADRYPSLNSALWRQAGENGARILMGMEQKWQPPVWDVARVRRQAQRGQVEHVLDPVEGFKPEDRRLVQLHQPCVYVLLRGRCWEYEIEQEDGEETEIVQINAFRFPCLLPSTFKFATFSENAVLYAMDEEMTGGDRARRLWGRLRAKIKSINLWAGLRGEKYKKCAIAIAFGRTPATEELQAFALAETQGRTQSGPNPRTGSVPPLQLDRSEVFAESVMDSQQLALARKKPQSERPKARDLQELLSRLGNENRALREALGPAPSRGVTGSDPNPLQSGSRRFLGASALSSGLGGRYSSGTMDEGLSTPLLGAEAPPPATALPLYDLRELASLHREGVLTDSEFAAAKARALGISPQADASSSRSPPPPRAPALLLPTNSPGSGSLRGGGGLSPTLAPSDGGTLSPRLDPTDRQLVAELKLKYLPSRPS